MVLASGTEARLLLREWLDHLKRRVHIEKEKRIVQFRIDHRVREIVPHRGPVGELEFGGAQRKIACGKGDFDVRHHSTRRG